MEEWRDIENYEGIYQVSNLGRVRSLDRLNSAGHRLKGRVLRSSPNSLGYHLVSLTKNGRQTSMRVHRLVALAFIENPHNKPQVNHLDGDKNNNYETNLEWSTSKENIKHALETGLMLKNLDTSKATLASNLSNSRAVYSVNRITKEKTLYSSAAEAARVLGVGRGNIASCLRGSIPSAYGFTWEYA